jgi:hypothetical protein
MQSKRLTASQDPVEYLLDYILTVCPGLSEYYIILTVQRSILKQVLQLPVMTIYLSCAPMVYTCALVSASH